VSTWIENIYRGSRVEDRALTEDIFPDSNDVKPITGLLA